jgi:predicted DNA-binding transcriptional regulator YafY
MAMRADRLLAVLMLLQSRGRMTARELAGELEVSERTIYRDLDALCAAGVPLLTEGGPGGGCWLQDSYRTTLTGLTEDEARALFMLGAPAALDALGMGRELRAAQLKLAAALPIARREDEARARQRIHLDSTWWTVEDDPTPHLRVLYDAVWESRRLRLRYRRRFEPRGELLLDHSVEPYGLVAKASRWHLVAAHEGRMRVYVVAQVAAAEILEDVFARSVGFDLPTFWRGWCAEVERYRSTFIAVVRASPELSADIERHFASRSTAALASAPRDGAGWVTMRLSFESLDEARGRLLALGGAVEVLEPASLRLSLADYAAQALARYC